MSPLCLDREAALISGSVDLVDDHDEAYEQWKARSVQNQILLHLDAHIDFEWIAEKNLHSLLNAHSFRDVEEFLRNPHGWAAGNPANNRTHLGNYLYRALEEGMIREWYWVVPDSIWNIRAGRESIWKDLLDFYKFRTGPMEFPKREKNCFKTSFLGVPTVVTSLEFLPFFEEPVLLNIDVDFLTTRYFKKIPKAETLRKSLPWIWPEELVRALRKKNVTASLSAIAHSVTGGFTPIQFKFFGEVLRALLSGDEPPVFYEQLKEAMILRSQGDLKLALEILLLFEAEGAIEVARSYQAAQIFYEQGYADSARLQFQKCVDLDAQFTSNYNNSAKFFEFLAKFEEAIKEHQMMQTLLPDSLEPQLGQARFFAAQRMIEPAIKCYHKVLEKNPDCAEAYRELGILHLQRKQITEAFKFFLYALELNAGDLLSRIRLGYCLFYQKRFDEAKNHLREALGRGAHFSSTYQLLARVYWRLNYRRKALEFFWESWRIQFRIYQARWAHRLRKIFLPLGSHS